METMMGVGEPLPAAIADAIGPPPARGLGARARVWPHRQGRARAAARGDPAAADQPRLLRAARRRAEHGLRPRSTRMPLTALAAEYRRIEAELLERWDAPLINDFLCMMAFGASRKLIERWAGAGGPRAAQRRHDRAGRHHLGRAGAAHRAHGRASPPAIRELAAALARGDRAALARDAELAQEVDELYRQVRRPLHRGAEARKHHAGGRSAAAAGRDRGCGADDARSRRSRSATADALDTVLPASRSSAS